MLISAPLLLLMLAMSGQESAEPPKKVAPVQLFKPCWIDDPASYFVTPPKHFEFVVGEVSITKEPQLSALIEIARTRAEAKLFETELKRNIHEIAWTLFDGKLYVLFGASPKVTTERLGRVRKSHKPDKSPPYWTKDPSSYFQPARDDLVVAVGSGSGPLAERIAMMQARAGLLNPEVSVETRGSSRTIRSSSQGTISGARVVARWVSLTGDLYILMGAPRSGIKNKTGR